MHDLIFALAFVAMVATPAMVAAIGGRKEYNPEPESQPAAPARFASPLIVPPQPRPAAPPKPFSAKKPSVPFDPGTLPIHRPRGLANR